MRSWPSLPLARGLLPLVPALVTLALILSFASDVPYGDEWDTPGRVLEAISKGSVTWQHFVEQHNESRKAVPRLIFALGTLLFGWRSIPYMVLGWLFALASMLLLLKMLARDHQDDPGRVLPIGLLVALLLFSPIQAQNQLWGIQMIVFIPPLCLVASLWVQSNVARYRNVVLLCALLSLIATWSFANGMLCWVLAFPLVRHWLSEEGTVAAERRGSARAWTVVYLALAAGSTALYFWNYRRPSHHPSFGVVLEDPALGVEFLATWLGTPFAAALGGDRMTAASLLGTLLLLMLFVVSAAILREWGTTSPRRFWLPYYPWICLTAYGVASGLLTTAGRAGFGQEQATSGRYCTFALWVIIGLVGMVAALWRSQRGRRLNGARVVCLLAAGAVSYLTLWSWHTGIDKFEELGHRTGQYLLTLRLLKVAPANPLIGCPRVECPYPVPERVLERTAALTEAGVLAVDFVGPWLTERLRSAAGGDSGEFRITGEGESRIRVVGWAALPQADRLPDFVVLGRAGAAGRPELVSGLIVKKRLYRETTPRVTGARNHAFFEESIATPPADASELRMFAVDLRRRQVHGLTNLGPASGFGEGARSR